MRNLFTLLLILITLHSFAATDSVNLDKWTAYKPALRIGIGVTPKFYPEFGFCLLSHYPGKHLSSSAFYASIELLSLMSADRGFLFAWPKIGYEYSYRGVLLAFEAKYQTGLGRSDIVFTPRIGASFAGIVNCSYGFNISTNGRPYPEYRSSQLNLAFNLYRRIFTRRKH